MTVIKNAGVVSALMALNALISRELPISGAVKVRTLFKSLEASWAIVEDVRKSLFEQFAEQADGKPVSETVNGVDTIKILPEHKAAFDAAWKELMEQPVEVKDSSVLTVADFGTKEVSADVLMALGDLFTA